MPSAIEMVFVSARDKLAVFHSQDTTYDFFQIKDLRGMSMHAMGYKATGCLALTGMRYDMFGALGRLVGETDYAHVLAWIAMRYGYHKRIYNNMVWIHGSFRAGVDRLLVAARRKHAAYVGMARGFRAAARRYRAAHVIADAWRTVYWSPYTLVGRNRLLKEYERCLGNIM